MKFLPENRNRTIILAVGGGICVIGIVYFVFFFGRSADVPMDAGSSTGANHSVRQSEIMPYGTKFNTDLFQKDKFKSLRPIPPLEVRSEELGQTNPFVR